VIIAALLLVGLWLFYGSVFRKIKTYKWLIISLFALKVVGAIALCNFYGKLEDRAYSDIFKYYDDGQLIKQAIKDKPALFFKLVFLSSSDDLDYQNVAFECGNWESEKKGNQFRGNRLMIRLNALLSFIFGSNYYLHVLIFTLLSFLGILMIVKSINSSNKILNSVALCVLTFSPSLLFWTSGVLKESILIFLIGLLFFHLRKIQLKINNPLSILASLLCLTFIWTIRSSMGYCFVFAILFGLMHSYLSWKIRYPTLLSIVLALSFTFLFLNYNSVNEKEIIGERRMEFLELAEISDAGSTYNVPVITNNSEILYKLPVASYNALFRPGIFDFKKSTYLPFILESLLLLALILSALIFGRIKGVKEKTLIHSTIVALLFMSTLIGISVPIFGASVRYRAPLILLLFTVLFILFDQTYLKRIQRKITKINP